MLAFVAITRKLNSAGHADEALSYGLRGIDLGEEIVRDDPGVIDIRVDLGDLHREVGNIWAWKSESARGIAATRRSVSLLEETSRANPLLFLPRRSLVMSLSWLANVVCDAGDFEEALQLAESAVRYSEEFEKLTPELLEAQELLGSALASLGKVEHVSKRNSEAIKTLNQGAGFLVRSSECIDLYNAACCLVRSSTIDDSAAAGSMTADQERRSRDADRAMDLLFRAFESGLVEPNLLEQDPDLEPIRSRETFQNLIQAMKDRLAAGGKEESNESKN
jgi:tetratricopeptide (TPR) repeat protein